MTRKSEDKWKILSGVIALLTAVSIMMNIVGIPSCDKYQTKEAAAAQQDEWKSSVADMIKSVNKLVQSVNQLVENQARHDERLKSLERERKE